LTLSWNRPDIAQTCLLTTRAELTQAQLDVCMFEALVDNRVEYVKLLIKNGVSIKNFLTLNRLQALYNACGSNSTLHLIAKDVIRGVYHHAQTRIYSLYEIGLIIEKLIGQGYRSSYTRRVIRHLCVRQPLSQRQNFNVNTDAEQKEQYSQLNNSILNEDLKKNSLADDPKFEFPYNELFVFAVLTKRHEMALFFWAHGEEALAKALIGCRLNKGLAREAQDDELDTEIADEFLSNAEDFQQSNFELSKRID
jgi:transient receptor potential cation channel subfamily M protein 3